jgi:oxazoline/thiazoline synthase
VMAAIGMHKSNGAISFGFGCHLRPQLAAQRALTELCQLIPIRGQKGADFDFDAIQAESYLFPQNVVAAPGVTEDLPTDLTVAINRIVEQLNQQQLETLVLNYSRASMPVKTAKVFVPGLCHIWPQLGNPRLYQVPVTLGWLNRAKTAADLNPQALYI